MCGFQDKFDVRVIPRRFIVSHGVIVELSKEIGELRGVLGREEFYGERREEFYGERSFRERGERREEF